MISWDLVTGIISFLLTVMILSYLFFGDKLPFRLAVYIFVGVSAGYAGAVAWQQVLYPRLIAPLISSRGKEFLLAIPLLLGVLLLMKLTPRTARLGNPAVAFLVGVGAAVAVGGAVMGTLFPQVMASINAFKLPADNRIEHLGEAIVMLIGTVATLIYFHYGAKATPDGPQQSKGLTWLRWAGQVFIAITFGVLFAGVLTAAMTALIERLGSMISLFAK